MNKLASSRPTIAAIAGLVLCVALVVTLLPTTNSFAGTIRFTYSRVWSQAPLYIGIKKGWYNTATLKTKFIDLRASMKMVEAMFAGDADGGALSLTAVLIARERGLDLMIVAPVASYKDGHGRPNGLYVRKDSGITSIKGLRGKQIGIDSYASSLDIETRAILLANGMDPKKDLQLLEVNIIKGLQAFMANRLDAYYFPASFIPALRNQQRRLATMFDIKEFKGQMILNSPAAIRQKFINENRDTAVEWATQYLKALRVVTDKPKEANALWSEWAKRPKNVSPYYLPRDGSVELQGVQSVIDLMLRYGYLKKPQKARDVVHADLMRTAARRLAK